MSSRPMLFGKYCLLERISVGGMAEVFRAKPLNVPGTTERYLALKRILPHLAEDEEFLKMFIDEAKLCVHLRHPNIVHIYELGRFQSSSYILMEYIPGQDLLALQKRLRKRRLIMSVTQACYIAMELAKGLDYAHKATDDYGRPLGIIHRDISPQNVLINYSGGVKLIDFGVAKADIQSTKTQAGVLKGKFGYMSPEQIRGEGAIDHRSDIFAVGTVLWELLTNRRLFTGDNEFEVFQKVRDARVDPPSTKNPQVPPEVDRIVMRSLTQDPNNRYAQASDMARELGQFLTSIQPLYTQHMLADWMANFFEEELGEERAKRAQFMRIRTADDVQRAYQEGLAPVDYSTNAPAPAAQLSPEEEFEQADATQIWDVDVAPQKGEDIESFAAAHTVVAAGGFDLNEFMALQDDDILESHDMNPVPIEEETVELESLRSSTLRENVATQTTPAVTYGFSTRIDGGGTQPRGTITSNMLSVAKRRRNTRAALAGVLVLCCVVLAIASAVLFFSGGDSPEPAVEKEETQVATQEAAAAHGVILVTSTPGDGVQIYLDGVEVKGETPLKIDEVVAGVHRLEVKHADFDTMEKSVEVKAGEVSSVDFVLSK